MPKNQDILGEFERHLTGEQKDIRDFLVNQRRAVQLILAVLVPVGFTVLGRLIDWQNLGSQANALPAIGFLVLLVIQALLVWVSLGWTPKLDRFAELSELRRMLLEVHREARAYKDASNAYSFALAALRSPLTPPEGAELPPILDADSGEEKFERLAAEIMAVFE